MQQGDTLSFEEKPIETVILKMIQDANILVKNDLKILLNAKVKNIEPQHLDLLLSFYKKGTFWS